jgi:heme oxygenase
MKQFATYFTHGVRNGSKLRTAVYQSHTVSEILEKVDHFFQGEMNPVAA